jgi:uncharacterized phage protein gp47/JayE
MPVAKKDYQQITMDILNQITGEELSEELVYKDRAPYTFSKFPVSKIIEVTGTSKEGTKAYHENSDYRLTGNALEWLPDGEKPAKGDAFKVKYRFASSTGISDLNPGSVVRTLVESVSREIEYLYEQLHAAYLSGFIESAENEALDMTVALLGLKRKAPQPSSGKVTFGRSSEPEKFIVLGEMHVFDGSEKIELGKQNVMEIQKVEGKVNGSDFIFSNSEFKFSGRSIIWNPKGNKPDMNTLLSIDYTAFQDIIIPKRTGVATTSPMPEETRIFITTEEKLLRPTSEGKWESDVSVTCTVPGKWGNVLAGTITRMPQPTMGVEYIINKSNITNGADSETDGELRERARHALDFAAKATNASLETALKGIKGVNSVLIDDMPDGVSGLVRVIIDGGDQEEIQRAIDSTRAAGIRVEFSRPNQVQIDVSLTLVLDKDASEARASREVEKFIRNYISSLRISDDVLYPRIVEGIMRVEGVWDVSDLEITAFSEGKQPVFSEKQNIRISVQERAYPRNVKILFKER